MLRGALTSLLFLAVSGGSLAAKPATQASNVSIERAWARATPPGVQVGAAYAVITNKGQADRLLKVTTPASARVEIHKTTQIEDRTQMRPVTTVELPIGGCVTFGPGGLHLMLVDLKRPLRAGTNAGARHPAVSARLHAGT